MAIWNSRRTFGVEIEVITHTDPTDMANDISNALIDAGYSDGAYYSHYDTVGREGNHPVPTQWKVMSDGSLHGEGFEVVSPILKGEDGFKQLKAVCSALVEPKYKVNKSCGLHIHHGMKDLDGESIGMAFGLYHAYQRVIHYMVSPSRRNTAGNIFTKELPDSVVNLQSKFKGMTKEDAVHHIKGRLGCYDGPRTACRCNARYHTMNPLSILHFKTIEFRQHHGTTDYEKIRNWILFTQSIIESAKEMKVFPTPASQQKAGLTSQKMMRQGNFHRLKSSTRYNPQRNPNINPERCRPFQDMWKYYNGIIKKFAQQAGKEVNELGM